MPTLCSAEKNKAEQNNDLLDLNSNNLKLIKVDTNVMHRGSICTILRLSDGTDHNPNYIPLPLRPHVTDFWYDGFFLDVFGFPGFRFCFVEVVADWRAVGEQALELRCLLGGCPGEGQRGVWA